MHHSQTDFAFLTGKLVRRIFSVGGTLNPHKCLDIISRAALAFLQRHLGTVRVWGCWMGFGRARGPPACRAASMGLFWGFPSHMAVSHVAPVLLWPRPWHPTGLGVTGWEILGSPLSLRQSFAAQSKAPGGCSSFRRGAGPGAAAVTPCPALPHTDLKEDFDRWEHLLDGIGDSVVPAAPPCRSNL